MKKKPTHNKNNIMCMWCGKDIVNHKTAKYGKFEIMGALAKHLLACKNHPLTRRIDELIKENRLLKGKITRLEKKLNKPCKEIKKG
ncbi:MAG TPA: hypothetical protein ENH82_08400 [bacterium]|nr:hypothetical protein [bacterium]